ncbi:hypothetical protein PG996_003742 [Apiospora saccharicola]|uniref:T6SS Phospholipase effector Tle1-like catalytic domain-containing protein n=1 Tax=Apiospora saccharicola TaxID=335842 RepID=A0ABR1W3G0_9PEZI
MMTEGAIPQREFTQGGYQETGTSVAPKRIVICCDSTWQSSVSGLKNIPSNITRLSRAISRSGKCVKRKPWQQVVYYDAGIGTGVLSSHEKNLEGGFGVGFVGNVIEAYNFIALNYKLGDEIFCFGFSRGAYTARAVAGLVNDIGVISPRDLQDFPDLYTLYQKHKESHNFRKPAAYREWTSRRRLRRAPSRNRRGTRSLRVVQVVGVFDTVGSLGIPDLTWTLGNLKWIEKFVGIPDPGFHNVALSPYIRRAFYALALDERRGPFSPTLWQFPADGDLAARQPVPKRTHNKIKHALEKVQADKDSTPEQIAKAWSDMIDCEMYEELKGTDSELLQVWFPGVHINVGGGSDDLLKEKKGDFEQIAMISFAWMCEQVAPYLQLDVDLGNLARAAVEDRCNLIKPVLDRIAHGEKDYGSNWLTRKGWEALDRSGLKKAQLKHVANDVVNGWATGPIVNSFSGTMTIAGAVYRTPGRYVEYKEKGKSPVKLGKSHEMVHHSVEYRKQKKMVTPPYDPEGLKGFQRDVRKSADPKRYEWTGSGNSGYLIKPEDVFSRYIAMQGSLEVEGTASDFIGEIDKADGAKTQEADTLDIREASKKG